jgi:hypothetical protein
MPCGSVPSIAALTRSGARKASEIAMFTLRAVQPSRLAIVSAVAVGSMTSSSSQRRPRAMEASKVVRFSERIRRTFCGETPSGKRIRVVAVFLPRDAERVLGSSRVVLFAVTIAAKVLHYKDRNPECVRQPRQNFCKRMDATCRTADSDHHTGSAWAS